MKLSHRIPILPWRATSTWSPRAASFAPLVGGLTLFGLGEGLLVQSRSGASPWTVFAQGVGLHLHLSVGTATLVISAAVLMLWAPLRERPGLGTIANMLVIAEVLNLTIATVPRAGALGMRCLFVAAALEAIGAGSALYLTTGLGPGPRDGLMTSLHRHLKVSVVYVRLALEVSVLGAGWLLGGTVGFGTACFAAGIGFSIGLNLSVVGRLSRHWQRLGALEGTASP